MRRNNSHRSLFSPNDRGSRLVRIGLALAVAAGASACAEMMSDSGLGSRSGSSGAPPAASPQAGKKTQSASGTYAVTFGVRSGSKLGAVQFDARSSAGDWQGSGDKVACSPLVSGAMHACNDKGGGLLSCGLIATSGIGSSADLVRCQFQAKAAISPGDFSVRVIDASNTSTKPVGADVVVTRVAAQ